MSVVKGFFFDLDGTLVNTYEADYLAYRDAIREVTGKVITAEEFAKTHGMEMRQKLQFFGFNLSEEKTLAVAAGKKKHYKKYVHKTKPNPDLVGLLHYLSTNHILVLVTTAKAQNARLVLEQHNLSHFFQHMVFGDDIKNPKPNPEAYQIALEKSGLQADEVLVFEDSDSGIESAKAAGLQVVKVASPK